MRKWYETQIPKAYIRIIPKYQLPKLAFTNAAARQLLPQDLVLFQKSGLLYPTLFEIDKQHQQQHTRDTQGKQKVEWCAIVAMGSVDDGARDQRADEARCFADDGEEAEEEELLAAGGDFRDLRYAL